MLLLLPGLLTAAAVALVWGMNWFRRPQSYAGRHVLVTGGSTGIGQAAAEMLAKQGAHVSLVARSQPKLDAAQAQIQAAIGGGSTARVRTFSGDVTNAPDMQRVIRDAEAAQGPLYGLICSAGSSTPGRFMEQDVSVFSDTMQLNYMGTVNVLKAALPGLVQRGEGHVVLVASVMAVIGFTGYASYAPSKWAVRGLCDCLRNELAGSGVSISIAYPPDTDTPGYENEKSLMPEEGRAIQDLGGTTLFPAQQVASGIVNGSARGDYHLRGPDVGLNILVASMAGFSPRMYNWVLEVVLAPFMLLLTKLAIPLADRTVRRHRAAKSQPI
jgi:short-subunit dehydrogenase